MGLSASMWTGVSGLINHGEKMNVVGNNIANVNTVGFKSQRMDFQDFMYQDSYSTSGITQIGRGVKIGAVMGDFSQGAFETTNEVTDIAIGGKGFFKVKPAGTDVEYFTRAGDFRFNKAGYLNDPNGYTLQGWKIDNTAGPVRASSGLAPDTNTAQIRGVGAPTDVRLDTWTVDPLQTTRVSFSMNLSKDSGSDKSSDMNNPFASLLNSWNGKQPPAPNTPAMPEDAYSGQPATIKVYDESGATHTLTVYFDKISPDTYSGGSDGETMWEYVVTMDPADDLRKIAVPTDPTIPMDPTNPGTYEIVDMKSTKDGGLLMSGTLTFDSAGKLKTQSAYVLNGTTKPATVGNPPVAVPGNGYVLDGDGNPVPMLDPENTADYFYPTEVSSSGFPMLVANFTGLPGAQTVGSVPDADKYLMELDFGLKVSDYTDPWTNTDSLGSLGYKAALHPNPISNTWGTGTKPTTGQVYPAPGYIPAPVAPSKPNLDANLMTSNGSGTPSYYYTNPDYDSSVEGSAPYVYASQADYRNAYNAAMQSARDRMATKAAPDMIGWATGGAADPAAIGRALTGDDVRGYPTAAGTTQYVYENPNYAGDNTQPQFVYADATSYQNAVTFQAANGRWPTPEDNVAGVSFMTASDPTKLTKADWPKTGLLAAEPPSARDVADIKPPAYRQANAFTSLGGGTDNTIKSASQNGYGFGDLSSYTISSEGILSGVYSNGVTLPLYQIALYDFTCKQGLRREGNNLFSQTLASGDPASAPAGTSGFGTINAQSLESSNVDLSTEFVQMITTQRGFQSNSKVITTVDSMLEVVIGMKR